jgi:hypothetical protein
MSKADCAGEGEWKNIVSSQARPNLHGAGHAFIVRRSGEIAGVERMAAYHPLAAIQRQNDQCPLRFMTNGTANAG